MFVEEEKARGRLYLRERESSGRRWKRLESWVFSRIFQFVLNKDGPSSLEQTFVV
jgi:hypothetical protein